MLEKTSFEDLLYRAAFVINQSLFKNRFQNCLSSLQNSEKASLSDTFYRLLHRSDEDIYPAFLYPLPSLHSFSLFLVKESFS